MGSDPDSEMRLLLLGPSQESSAKLAQKLLGRTTEQVQYSWAETCVHVFFGSRGHRKLRVALAPDFGARCQHAGDVPYCNWLVDCVEKLEGSPVILLVLNSRCPDMHLQDLRKELEAAFPHIRSSIYNHCAVVFLRSRREASGAHAGGDEWMPELTRQLATDCGSRWCLCDEDDQSDDAITCVVRLIARVAGHDSDDDDAVSAGNFRASDVNAVTERGCDVIIDDVKIDVEIGRDNGRQSSVPVAWVLPCTRPTTAPPRVRPVRVNDIFKLPEAPRRQQTSLSPKTERETQTRLRLPPVPVRHQQKTSSSPKTERETQTRLRLPPVPVRHQQKTSSSPKTERGTQTRLRLLSIPSLSSRTGVKAIQDRHTQTEQNQDGRSRTPSSQMSYPETERRQGRRDELEQLGLASLTHNFCSLEKRVATLEERNMDTPAQNQWQLALPVGQALGQLPPTVQNLTLAVQLHNVRTENQYNINVEGVENAAIGNQPRFENRMDG